MTMSKIQMTTPLVEMDGDEMTRILWKMIKDELLLPFIDLKTEYYDLGLEHRTRQTIRLHLIPQKQQRNMELQSNVQRSLQMQRVWMNMI